ncbi:MAG: 50S ribosomal protein L10 [Myxococcales bacterium]|nr:50S ribosomal protein L10 [Myxococcales bacterium]MCB9749944.1 50S ribosomal protein L10 [Myxococcales bacterium]
MEQASKQEQSQQLREQITDASALVLLDYSGMTVAEVTDLRNKFREAGCSYKVYKNSTIRFAVKDTPHEPLTGLLKGMTGLAFNLDDPGAPARIARDVAKEVEALGIKGGIMEGNLLDEAGVKQLADMPGPRELKSMFLRLLNTPATNMVRVLNAVPQSLLFLLNAKQEKDEKGGDAAA